jgi:hypothetical protein
MAQQQTAPATPPAPPPSGQQGPAGEGGLEGRVGNLEAEQKRQGGMLEQILARLPEGGRGRGGQAADPDTGKSVGQLVREGIEELERDKAARADAEAAAQARKDHAARIKALEERAPKETAPGPVGRLRSAVQRVGFGIDEPHR